MGTDQVLIAAIRTVLVVWGVGAACRQLALALKNGRSLRPSEALLRAVVMGTLIAVWSTALLGFSGRLNPHAVALSALAACLMAWATSRFLGGSKLSRHRLSGDPVGRLWFVVAPSILLVAVDLLSTLPTAPSNWDAMICHLYFPASCSSPG